MCRRAKGQAILELALVAPFVIALIVFVVDLGRFFSAWISVTNSAREAAYYGSQSVAAGGVPDDAIRRVAAAEGSGASIAADPTYVTIAYPSPDLISVTVRSPFEPIVPIAGAIWGERAPWVSARAAFRLQLPTATGLVVTPSTPTLCATPLPTATPTPPPDLDVEAEADIDTTPTATPTPSPGLLAPLCVTSTPSPTPALTLTGSPGTTTETPIPGGSPTLILTPEELSTPTVSATPLELATPTIVVTPTLLTTQTAFATEVPPTQIPSATATVTTGAGPTAPPAPTPAATASEVGTGNPTQGPQ